MGVSLVETHETLCSKAGLELIQGKIDSDGLDAVVIGACSGRDKTALFQFPNVFVERSNLREGVAWTHDKDDEDDDDEVATQELANDVIRMSIAKAKSAKLPKPQTNEMTDRIVVIGGGPTGISAALSAAEAGKEVVLVEKEDKLGGFANKLFKVFPRDYDIAAYEKIDLDGMIAKIEANDKITVHLSAEIGRIVGAPGKFDVTINKGSDKIEVKADSFVLAAGWKPYDATKLSHLGYGKPNVITNIEFEQMAKEGKISGDLESVVFVQCAGSRDDDHLPYCSNVCCGASLKHVTYLKEMNPEIATYVIYKDIRAPGHYEEVYKKVQKLGTLFVKGEVQDVDEGDEGKLNVMATDALLGEDLFIEADLVVLATGLVPTTLDAELLHLEYRQGPELPQRDYGFPNSHFICFPYETQRTGIYAAGAVRMPMDIAQAIDDGAGAAAKAVQVSELVREGKATHPRVGDFSLPDINFKRCTSCKRCTEECPFGALDEDEKGTPLPNPTRCRRCGTCMGACPERVITFENYSVPMIGNMIKAMEVPDEFEERPRVLVLACENDAIAALDMAAHNGLKLNPYFRVIPLRCLGSMNLVWIADALAKGIDGIMLMGCKFGDDYQCHFVKGSELANVRMTKVQETLDRLMLESERIRFEQIGINDYDKIPAMWEDFAEKLEELGPNPYKE